MTPQPPSPNPCRKCKGEADVRSAGTPFTAPDRAFRYICTNCQCDNEGPIKTTERKALLAWNEENPLPNET